MVMIVVSEVLIEGVTVGLSVVVVVAGGLLGEVGEDGLVPSEGLAWQVVTCRPAVKDARPSFWRGSSKPAGTVPTKGLKLYRPQGQTLVISISEVSENRDTPSRVKANFC